MLAYPEVAILKDTLLISSPIYADLVKTLERDKFLDNIMPKSPFSDVFGMKVYVHDSILFNTKAKEQPIYENNLKLTPTQLAAGLRTATVLPVRDGFVNMGTLAWFRHTSGPRQVNVGTFPHTFQDVALNPLSYSIAKPGVKMGLAQVAASVDYTKVDLQQVRLADGYLVAPSNPPLYLWFYNSLTQRAERHVAKDKVNSWRASPHLWFRNEPMITPGRFVAYTD
ncbi:hypothetical protein [Caulobacter phage KSC]|uniref:Uncharacterized protein n=1 Tax=Caulobacter phage KSC TaxID=3020398 RepID=A0AAE9WZ22_9CAUD|nr:hypothetical protein [Caulobacter phage KSC]